ncbi:MAG: EamA family transporter [Nocardioides sp.]|uniref:EamA family transporter n=1 Tax=Nocardioides sp. TaxID=35761 RepID=UPI0039E343F7
MPATHRLIAVGVAVCWGLNFLAIDASLTYFPPMFLVALRFALIAVPTLVAVPRPQVELRWLIGYGIGFGTLQFVFLYWGMAVGMPAGLASLVLQSSAPFTVMLGAIVFRDRVSGRQLAGLLIATAGLALVGRADQAALGPFLLVLAGGLGWAIGNQCNARAKAEDPWRLMLWMSVVPPLPMLAVSLLIEGPHRIAESLTSWSDPHALPALAGLAYTVVIGTLVGSGLWAWLMARHSAGVVAPFSMLVPVVGMSTAWVVLGESLGPGEILGAAAVVAGVLWGSRTARRNTPGADQDLVVPTGAGRSVDAVADRA